MSPIADARVCSSMEFFPLDCQVRTTDLKFNPTTEFMTMTSYSMLNLHIKLYHGYWNTQLIWILEYPINLSWLVERTHLWKHSDRIYCG